MERLRGVPLTDLEAIKPGSRGTWRAEGTARSPDESVDRPTKVGSPTPGVETEPGGLVTTIRRKEQLTLDLDLYL